MFRSPEDRARVQAEVDESRRRLGLAPLPARSASAPTEKTAKQARERARRAAMSPEEREAVHARARARYAAVGRSPEQKERDRQRAAEAAKRIAPEKRAEYRANYQAKLAAMTDADRGAHRLKINERARRYRATGKTAEQKAKEAQVSREFYRARAAEVAKVKLSSGCARCGERHLACLQFHHEDPAVKEANISKMVRSRYTIEDLQAEMAKCIVLCANCHFKEHWRADNPLGLL